MRTRRRALAEQIGAAYAVDAGVAAVILGGSVARGEADRFSDIEIGVFWRNAPTDEERTEAIERAGGVLERLWPFDTEESAWFDDWKTAPGGVSVEPVHMTVAGAGAAIRAAVERFDPKLATQVLLSVLVDGIPLAGEDVLARWREAATPYPDALAAAVVKAHAQIDHFWRFEMYRERDSPLYAYRDVVRIHEAVLHALLAVNRVYWYGFKSLDSIARRLRIAPPDLPARIRRAYAVPIAEAEPLLAQLVEETYDLVERHVPGVDVERLREIFRYRRPLWDEEA